MAGEDDTTRAPTPMRRAGVGPNGDAVRVPVADGGQGSLSRPQWRERMQLRWRRVFGRCVVSRLTALSMLHDMFTVTTSTADLVTDVAVTVEFHQQGRMEFFSASLATLCMAQVAYSFLFTGTYGREGSWLWRMVVFVLVMPFAQLVPLFAWLESHHFRCVDEFITCLGLKPTDDPEKLAHRSASDTDTLWVYMQRKYRSHAGFLAESLCEAIPQAVLQIAAVVTSPGGASATTLNLTSILLSVTVVASKGWVVSHSIHRPTFVFNLCAVAADVLALFSGCTWAFICLLPRTDSSGAASDASTQMPSEARELALVFVGAAACGAASVTLCTFATAMLMSFDDHLKLRLATLGHWHTPRSTLEQSLTAERRGSSDATAVDLTIWFDLYVCRMLGWVCTVLPVTTCYCVAKLTYIPTTVLRSLDPDHALHANFYRRLYTFLRGPPSQLATSRPRIGGEPDEGTSDVVADSAERREVKDKETERRRAARRGHEFHTRMRIANSVLGLAGEEKVVLEQRLSYIVDRRAKERAIRRWLCRLGTPAQADEAREIKRNQMRDQEDAFERARERALQELASLQSVQDDEVGLDNMEQGATAGITGDTLNNSMDQTGAAGPSRTDAAVRRLKVVQRLGESGWDLVYRSALAAYLLGVRFTCDDYVGPSRGRTRADANSTKPIDMLTRCLRMGGCASVVVLGIGLAVCVPATILFMVMSVLLPVVIPLLVLPEGTESVAVLPLVLSGCYVAAWVVMLLLVPRVWAFHRVRRDLVNIKELRLPEGLVGGEIGASCLVYELWDRCVRKQLIEQLWAHLERRVGPDPALMIMSSVVDGRPVLRNDYSFPNDNVHETVVRYASNSTRHDWQSWVTGTLWPGGTGPASAMQQAEQGAVLNLPLYTF